MKSLMTLTLAASILLFSGLVASAQISVEPDDFTEGTDISNAVTGVTLSAAGSGWNGAGPGILAVDPSTKAEPFTASTGSLVFGTDDGSFPHLFREAGFLQLRADFAFPADSVSLDFIGNNGSDFGELKAYDSTDTLIDSAATAQLTTSAVETLTVTAPGIAYIIAGGTSGDSSLGMDNMLIDMTIEVAVDIKPGSCPNPFNGKSQGSVPVAIVGTADFDVTQVDPSTVTLAGVPALDWELLNSTQPDGDNEDCYTCFDADDPANFNCDLWDTTVIPPVLGQDGILDSYCGDAYMDLVLQFDTQELAAAIGAADRDVCIPLTLEGLTLAGASIEGSDSVVIKTKLKD